jgi:hypothetical protein
MAIRTAMRIQYASHRVHVRSIHPLRLRCVVRSTGRLRGRLRNIRGSAVRALCLGLVPALSLHPVLLRRDPLRVDSSRSTRSTSAQNIRVRRFLVVPTQSTNLPPLRTADDAMAHLGATKRLDEVLRGEVATAHRDRESDEMDPRRAWSFGI